MREFFVAEQRRQRGDGVLAADDGKLPAGIDLIFVWCVGVLQDGDQLALVRLRRNSLAERLHRTGQQQRSDQDEMYS